MAKYNGKYRIESHRCKYWDYSAPGSYFVTFNLHDRKSSILGIIVNKRMNLSICGSIVANHIKQIPAYHPRIRLDAWIVMPDHIHLLITLMPVPTPPVAPMDASVDTPVKKIHEFSLPPTLDPPSTLDPSAYLKQYRKNRRKMLLPKIVGKLKMQSSKQINLHRNTPGITNWQASYHDHVVRNPQSYQRIKSYILNNPRNHTP